MMGLAGGDLQPNPCLVTVSAAEVLALMGNLWHRQAGRVRKEKLERKTMAENTLHPHTHISNAITVTVVRTATLLAVFVCVTILAAVHAYDPHNHITAR